MTRTTSAVTAKDSGKCTHVIYELPGQKQGEWAATWVSTLGRRFSLLQLHHPAGRGFLSEAQVLKTGVRQRYGDVVYLRHRIPVIYLPLRSPVVTGQR
jgi:hypothetical protein